VSHGVRALTLRAYVEKAESERPIPTPLADEGTPIGIVARTCDGFG